MKKVLIIDDDPVFIQTLRDRLSDGDYDVLTANTGTDGLASIDNESPDIVLLDILMPEMSGIGVLKELAGRGPIAVPIIVTSNLTGMDEISDSISLGAKGYIIKSNENLDSIVKTIEQNLGE